MEPLAYDQPSIKEMSPSNVLLGYFPYRCFFTLSYVPCKLFIVGLVFLAKDLQLGYVINKCFLLGYVSYK